MGNKSSINKIFDFLSSSVMFIAVRLVFGSITGGLFLLFELFDTTWSDVILITIIYFVFDVIYTFINYKLSANKNKMNYV